MLACWFLIDLSSKLLVTRSGIKARSNSILGRIKPLMLELLALEWQNFHTLELEYLWSQLVNLDQILCVASLGWGKGCIRFWGRLTWHIALRWAIVALWATCCFSFINPHLKVNKKIISSRKSTFCYRNECVAWVWLALVTVTHGNVPFCQTRNKSVGTISIHVAREQPPWRWNYLASNFRNHFSVTIFSLIGNKECLFHQD